MHSHLEDTVKYRMIVSVKDDVVEACSGHRLPEMRIEDGGWNSGGGVNSILHLRSIQTTPCSALSAPVSFI